MAFLGFPMWLWGLIVVFWLIGVVSFPILSLIIAPVLPPKLRKPFGTTYVKLGMLALDRAMLIFRRDGSYSLLPSEYDAEKEAEKVIIEGEPRYFTDSAGLMGSLARRKLGIAVENVSAVLNPAIVAVGEAQGDKLADGEGYVRAYWDTDDPNDEDRGEWVAAMNPYTKLKDNWVVVNMREIWSILEGSSDSDLAQRTQKRTLASQAHRVKDKTMVTIGIWIGLIIFGWIMRDVSIPQSGGRPAINMPFTVLPGWAFDVLLGVIG